MASLRVTVLVLVLANVLALSAWKGWMGGGLPHGEPERLSNQLNPDKIRLVTDGRVAVPAASSAKAAGESTSLKPVEQAAATSAEQAAESKAAPAEEKTPAPAPAPEKHPEAALTKAAAPAHEETAPPACVAFVGLASAQAAELSARIVKAGSGFQLTEQRSGTPSSWWVHIPSQGNKEGADRKAAEVRRLGVEDLFIVQDPGPNQYAISLGLFKNETAANRHLSLLKEKGVRSALVATRGSGTVRVEVRGPSDSLATLASDLSGQMRGVSRQECSP